ncbi:D-galactarolactone cycloisomerase [Melghirimyces profundicolus]|uniref:D-galactarolactone cycloisomerase n=1 Tax=Melghirimyces profundicolus TaxID=1242148 RepID=A0A2T6C0I7_9BACL|nr:mandelate racemase/muconate lactonizing enzyme family protein [Melghirimyces profundicolus]PTX61843.1 D-galactarolactone cycloisomerase [Melghirimyces profundicolus]
MKIHQVDTYPLFFRLKEPYGDANGYKFYRSAFWFRIRTQSGIEGWGECVDWLPVLEKGFQERVIPFLLGQPSTKRLQLVSTIKKWHPRIAAGVSMALTEIAAKKAGMSVCDLWGGKRWPKVPVYASFQSYTDRPDWAGHSLRMVEQAVADGFRQLKVKVGGKSLREDQQHISSLKAMLGGQAQAAVDANQSYDVATALRWNRLFESGGDWLWFEEPIPLDRADSYRLLRSRCPIPVAGGENLPGPKQFLPLLQENAVDIMQPDVMHVNGVDDFRDTLQLARHFGLRVSPHAFDGILSRCYALLAQSCLSSWSKMDGEEIEPVEWDAMENPFTSLLPIRPSGGSVTIPEGVGIGMEPDPQLLEAYRWDGSSYG